MKIRGQGTADIFNGIDSKAARKACPSSLQVAAADKLDAINVASGLADLRIPSGNRLKPLTGDRKGQYSIRINDQFRICFRWVDGEAIDVEVTDYH